MRVNACVRACVSVCASRLWLCWGLTPDTGGCRCGAAAEGLRPPGLFTMDRARRGWVGGVGAAQPARRPARALCGRASGMERELWGLRDEREREPQFSVADGGALP